MHNSKELLENDSYGKLILHLCVPSMVIMVVMVVYNMADTFFIGQTGSPEKIAAVSICAPLFSILSGLGTLLGNGGCTSISLALGKREGEKIKAVTSFCCAGALLLGIAFLAVVFPLAPFLSKVLGANAETMPDAVNYLKIIAVGAPLILFNNIFSNIIRADGAAAQSMLSNLLGTVTNIILDAIFILVFHWDVPGAAFATVLGNLVSCLYLICYMARRQPMFSLRPGRFSFTSGTMIPVLTLGLPMACSTLLMSISHIFSNNLMVQYGNTAIAAQGVAGKIGMLITMLAMGICMGFQPAISYNYAQKNWIRLRKIIWDTGVFVVTIGMALAVVCFLFRKPLIESFINNAQVVEYAQIMVLASLLTGPFYGLYQLCQVFLQSTGKASYATLVSSLDKGIIFLPTLFLFNHCFGMYGIAFTGCATLVVSLTVATILSLAWKREIHMTVAKQ